MVFWKRRTYVSTYYISTAYIALYRGGYPKLPDISRFGCITVRWWSTQWWNLPRVLSIMGVITQVSKTNNRVA